MHNLSVNCLFGTFGGDLGPKVLALRAYVDSLLMALFGANTVLMRRGLCNCCRSFCTVCVTVPAQIVTNVMATIIFSLVLPAVVSALGGRFVGAVWVVNFDVDGLL